MTMRPQFYDPDAFQLHTVDNWENSSAHEQSLIVQGNLRRVNRGADCWNRWVTILWAWATNNDIPVCIYFNNSEWVGNTTFAGFRFPVQVSFFRARFVADPAQKGDIIFSGVRFDSDANFVDAKFYGTRATFDKTTFRGYADFSHTEFDRPYLSFANATFLGDLSLKSAKVIGCSTEFAGADFHGNAIFNYTEFNRLVDFRGATFRGGQVLFEGVILHGKCGHFADAEFSARVTRFRGFCLQGVDFSRAIFSRNVVFKDIRFLGSCFWENADFREAVSFIDCRFEQVPDFNFATFKQPPHLASIRIPWLPKRSDGAPNTEAYRKLKQMAKDVGDHQYELKYFAYELHTKLYLEKTSNVDKMGMVIYRELSDFGQSLMRPVLWAVGLFGLTAAIQWTALAERPTYPNIDESWQLECKLEKGQVSPCSAIVRERLNAALIFLPTDRMELARVSRCLYGDEGYKPIWSKVMNILHSLLSAACIFLFGLGVRNRFKMK